MDSPYTDLDRPPLSQAALARALVRPGSLWSSISVVPETGSTNADLAEAARAGEPEGAVLVTEYQSAGRGRLGRRWSAPPRSGLMFSMLLRPAAPVVRQGWLPLLVGLAVATAVRRIAEVDVRLKWPNDLLLGERKLAGVLAERVADGAAGAVVVGVGLNVSLREHELPVETATSLAIAKAACTDRDPLLRAALREVERHYRDWTAAGGDADAAGLRAAYLAACATVGRTVRVELPGGQALAGEAVGVDGSGGLLIRGTDGAQAAVSAGEVVHVRPAAG